MRLHDVVDYHAREQPNATLAVLGDLSTTYGEVSEQFNGLANAFSSAGIQRGNRVAVQSKTSKERLERNVRKCYSRTHRDGLACGGWRNRCAWRCG